MAQVESTRHASLRELLLRSSVYELGDRDRFLFLLKMMIHPDGLFGLTLAENYL